MSASKQRPSARHAGRRPAVCGSEGFTLLEALIAIVILAMSLSALTSSFGGGLRGVSAVDDHLRARLVAQSVMEELSRDRGPQPATREGRFDKFAWRLSIAPYDDVPPPPHRGWRMHRLVMTVAWSPGRQIELQTLRMMRTR